jgi:hypothetical protein
MNIERIIDEWVRPVYMQFLHGNFAGFLLAEVLGSERGEQIKTFRRCIDSIEPDIVATLLNDEDWRCRMVGGWYAGLRLWTHFAPELGALLVESRSCYACQGYCAALACFADEASAQHLRRYLDVWLPQTDKFYDQHWAMPALVWVDDRLRTQHAAPYLEPGGLWDQWAGANYRMRYVDRQRAFDRTLASALAAFR